MTTHTPITSDDDMRIEEGRRLALACLGKVFDPKDVPDIALVLAHESADAYELVLGEGASVVGRGWIVLVGARPERPVGRFAPVARFSRDDLLLTLCVGKHNIITTVAHDELVSSVGGEA